jgi:hypothetical protein
LDGRSGQEDGELAACSSEAGNSEDRANYQDRIRGSENMGLGRESSDSVSEKASSFYLFSKPGFRKSKGSFSAAKDDQVD